MTAWISANGNYFEEDLNGGLPLPSNGFSYTLKVPKYSGYANIGIRPTMAKDGMAANYTTATLAKWMPPKPADIDIQGNDVTGVDFAIVLPDIDFTISVKDTSGASIPKAHVYAYSPSGTTMGLYGDTDMYGQITFKVTAGTYTYGAYIEGLPSPPEGTQTVVSTASGNLVISLPSHTIEGYVLKNGSDPLSNVSIYAYQPDTSVYRHIMTDSQGKYKLYVENGIWKIGGWVPSYGPLTEIERTVSSASLSNVNFSVDAGDLRTITGTVKIGNSSGT